jgi:hypothetical protein
MFFIYESCFTTRKGLGIMKASKALMNSLLPLVGTCFEK